MSGDENKLFVGAIVVCAALFSGIAVNYRWEKAIAHSPQQCRVALMPSDGDAIEQDQPTSPGTTR